jgi:hypothetical protein
MPSNFVRFADVQATGLLEQPVLLVRPADDSGRRWLEDAQGQAVGFAWHSPLLPWWLRWSRRPLTVHETDDEPMVFQVQRQWALLPRWQVADADGEVVGSVAGAWLLDRWEQPLLGRRRAPDGGGTFAPSGGQKAAEWSREGDRLRLVFYPPVQDEPFLKMLILASVLLS